MLLILPAGLQFFVDLAGCLFERKSRGGNGGSFALTVAVVNRVFSVIDELAHGKRFVLRLRERDFWISAELSIPTLAGHGAGET
ncbi:hypothetical protein BMUNKI379_25195 [Burkholderia multivorans]|nr:hypothetical protein BMUNKI379_25195 [Burkholderia multivorans]KVQ74000.1 hypothetical protein WK07_23620 [Burkholderia multivorans]